MTTLERELRRGRAPNLERVTRLSAARDVHPIDDVRSSVKYRTNVPTHHAHVARAASGSRRREGRDGHPSAHRAVATSCGAACGYDEYALYCGPYCQDDRGVSAAFDESELRRVARDCEASGAHGRVEARADASPARDVLRVIVADARTPGLARVLKSLGVELTTSRAPASDGGFVLGRTTPALTILVATIADPDRDGLPLTIYWRRNRTRSTSCDLTPAWRPAFRWRHIEREGRWNERGEVG